jgi:hypothetical protein
MKGPSKLKSYIQGWTCLPGTNTLAYSAHFVSAPKHSYLNKACYNFNEYKYNGIIHKMSCDNFTSILKFRLPLIQRANLETHGQAYDKPPLLKLRS